MLEGLNENLKSIEAIRALKIPNSLAPAFLFDPVLPGMQFESQVRPMKMSTVPAPMYSTVPKKLEILAFASVRELAELLRTGRVTATALTQMYLARLRRYDPQLKFVITLTEERALAQAIEARCMEVRGGRKIFFPSKAIQQHGAPEVFRNKFSKRMPPS
jgi:hypothetical protein